ncbi:MAG: NusG domain II-containing protein [Bianqueaceae bacterium]
MYRILLSYLGYHEQSSQIFKKTDLLLIGGLCVLALILLLVTLSSLKERRLKFIYDICVLTCDLSEVRSSSRPGAGVAFRFGVENKFLSSDCPDQVCVRTGFISLAGQTAVCLPHRLVVRIISDSPSDLDVII